MRTFAVAASLAVAFLIAAGAPSPRAGAQDALPEPFSAQGSWWLPQIARPRPPARSDRVIASYRDAGSSA